MLGAYAPLMDALSPSPHQHATVPSMHESMSNGEAVVASVDMARVIKHCVVHSYLKC